MRSRTWDRGRNDSTVSLSENARISEAAWMLESRLAWVRMTPLGTPVVPEV